MPPRSKANRGASPTSFSPPNDTTTYRDLLLFEERLKTNAASLQKRKVRYQLFLAQLVIVTLFLLYEALVPPAGSFLAAPYTAVVRLVRPRPRHRLRIDAENETDIKPGTAAQSAYAYTIFALLFVCVTTLVLFFASGLYAEKIGYANKYVPHANRALRSFNMYLNVRQPPLATKISLNPLAFFFPRPSPSPSPSPSPATPATLAPAQTPTRRTAVPISPIPPSSNPRGELIFSSRVDRAFRDAYERYRAAFERKRAEKERERKRKRIWWRWVMVFWGFDVGGDTSSGSGNSGSGSGGGGSVGGGPMTPKGRGTPRSGTPPAGAVERRGSKRAGTPVGAGARQTGMRHRAKSPAVQQHQPPGSPT